MVDKALKNSHEFVTLKESKNCYLLSRFPALASLVHPVLESEVNKQLSAEDTEDNVDEIKDFNELKTLNPEISYYTALYLFLKQYNFFNRIPVASLQQFNYSPEDFQDFIASTENIVFEATEKCELACTYCGYGQLYDASVNRRDRNLQFRLATNLLDFVCTHRRNIGTDSPLLLSFYGGEPFLNFNLIDQIIKYIKNSGVIDEKLIKYRITTNGILLEKYMDTLIANDIILTISLDGDRIHNRYRIFANGKESFDSVYSQILTLKHKSPEYFKRRVNFNSVLTDIGNLQEIEDFFWKNFRKPVKISELSPVGVKKENYDKFRKMYRTITQSFRGSMGKSNHIKKHPVSLRLFNLLVAHSDNFIFQSRMPGLKSKENFAVRTGTCKPFRKKIFCTVDGSLLPCEKIPREFSLAKVTETGVEIDYNRLAEKFRHWNSAIADMCMNCGDGVNCLNCLFFIDFSGEKPGCNRFCTGDAYTVKIQEMLEMLESNPDIYNRLFERK